MKKISKNVRKQIFNVLFVLVLLGLTVGILFGSNEDLSYRDIKNYFASCNLWYFLGGFLCLLGFILFEAVSLHLIFRRLGYKPKLRSSIAYSTSDLYYSAITPSATGGQPASAVYMVRDGIDGGSSGFGLILNLFAYTGAIVVIGLVAFIAGFSIFKEFTVLVKVIVIIGFVLQILLFGFFFACMKYERMIRKFGMWGISLVTKMKLMKKPEKWRAKWEGAVEKYHSGFVEISKHRWLFVWVLLLNILQRLSQLMITYFVCAAVVDNVSPVEIFCAQAFITLGYNSFPLPGGAGVYELLYVQSYNALGYGVYGDHFVEVAVMITRLISYYIMMIVCAAYTLVYHVVGGKKKQKEPDPAPVLCGEQATPPVELSAVAETDSENVKITTEERSENYDE